ncbi:MAG: sodium:solute symporter [Deltaproteobacteria bacterium]|nr:MAG: sodium:solute symporter [Deltaproteobacteria bacterium]
MSAMAWGLVVFIVFFFVVGIGMYYLVQQSGRRFIICGKSLPFFLVGTMLLAQSLDANATMGNAAGVYGGGWWAGFQFPFGLALCLFVVGCFYAKPLNRMNMLTLPDFYFRRFNWFTEIISGLLMIFSFAILVAGNFAGAAWIVSIIFKMDYVTALIIIAIFIMVYTVSGGLYSCAATDIVQIYPALIGFVGGLIYLLATHGWGHFSAAIPSNFTDLSGLYSIENGALLNWAGILALGIGDVVALDFMERVFAARTPEIARKSCFYGAVGTLVAGVVCSYMGLMGLTFFPEIADARMILPTIGQDMVPYVFGLLMLGGIIAAGASTADGGILGVSAVLGRNILQRNILLPLERRRKALGKDEGREISDEEAKIISDRNLLIAARIMAIPVVAFAIFLAIVKPEPGIMLVLAFDVVFAGCLVPLTLGIYWKKANTPGALAAIFVGSILRLILFYQIPEHLAGLDTLIPPVVSLMVMVPVSLLTQKTHPPKHHVIDMVPDDADVIAGIW